MAHKDKKKAKKVIKQKQKQQISIVINSNNKSKRVSKQQAPQQQPQQPQQSRGAPIVNNLMGDSRPMVGSSSNYSGIGQQARIASLDSQLEQRLARLLKFENDGTANPVPTHLNTVGVPYVQPQKHIVRPTAKALAQPIRTPSTFEHIWGVDLFNKRATPAPTPILFDGMNRSPINQPPQHSQYQPLQLGYDDSPEPQPHINEYTGQLQLGNEEKEQEPDTPTPQMLTITEPKTPSLYDKAVSFFKAKPNPLEGQIKPSQLIINMPQPANLTTTLPLYLMDREKSVPNTPVVETTPAKVPPQVSFEDIGKVEPAPKTPETPETPLKVNGSGVANISAYDYATLKEFKKLGRPVKRAWAISNQGLVSGTVQLDNDTIMKMHVEELNQLYEQVNSERARDDPKGHSKAY